MVAVAVIPGSPGSPGHPDSAAAAVLGQAAVTASGQPATPAAGPGQYEYVKVIEEQRGRERDAKIGDKTSRGRHVTSCRPSSTGWHPTALAGCRPSGGPSCGFPTSETFTAGQADDSVYPDAAALPTDPAALEQIIVQKYEGGKADAGATFHFAGTILQSGGPPKVRAALYRLIESLPGVQLLGSMTDKLGRHGIAVGYTQYGIRDTLIFDPATSAVLEREGVVVDPAEILPAPESRPSSSARCSTTRST